MFKKSCIIEIGDNYLTKHDPYSRFFKRGYIDYEYNIGLLKETQFCLSKRKAFLVIEGEKINIKYMSLPNIKKQKISKLVADELSCCYSDLDKIYFSFSIVRESGNSIDVIVFYSSDGKVKRIENYATDKKCIYKVYLIQFCFLKYYKAKIKHNDFIFAFVHKSNLYLLGCKDRRLICNETVIYSKNPSVINEYLTEFGEGCRINNGLSLKNIYISNIDEELCKDLNLNEYSVVDLGKIDEKSLLNSIKNNRSK